MNWADKIHEALEATDDAFSALYDARKEGKPTSKLDRISQEAAAYSTALQAQCRDAFARSRGWTYNKKAGVVLAHNDRPAFNSGRLIDHGEMFDSINERRVALVTHSYASAQDLADYGARHNYNAELLPFSWYSPRGCQAVVFTRRLGAEWPK